MTNIKYDKSIGFIMCLCCRFQYFILKRNTCFVVLDDLFFKRNYLYFLIVVVVIVREAGKSEHKRNVVVVFSFHRIVVVFPIVL